MKISHTVEVADGTNLAANVWAEMIDWLNHLTSSAIVPVD
ncbi:hypothetical protein DFR24_2819 [Panacagrimonas perspica]|uniref:Uncharacterized protein n=1 Tax=Panacagrimonas perspica TaxID=381431 RepID=A0A4R7P4W7_9GAMM|nr:hypothetical protein DFR24_2819 [Panacagrimonas perspica]